MINKLQRPCVNGRTGQPSRCFESLEARQVPSALPLVADPTTTNAAYVEAVYQGVLGRPADPAGFDWGTSIVDSGQPRANLAGPMVSSEEASSQFIRSVYEHYLGREADAAGITFWLAEMQAGARN
ncbi:MAG TPA: DUF4214 domain-containing protein, partial [Pirellulales bacterium]|nr:DUF4214 domain-containing protein [Pirellulales bacterium]